MAPARFAEAAHEQRRRRRRGRAAARRACARSRSIAARGSPSAASLRRSSAIATSRAAERFERGNRRVEHGRRQVFDAVKAQIFKRLNRLAQARTGEARHEDDAQRNSYEALFARTRQRPHSEAGAADRGAARSGAASSRSSCSNPIRRCTTSPPRRPRLAAARSALPAPRFGELKHEIGRLIYRIESFGCVVKDIDLGLVDFPSTLDDEPIYLCWKAGRAAKSPTGTASTKASAPVKPL